MTPLLRLGLAMARNAAARRPPGHALPTSPARFRIGVEDPRCRDRIAAVLSGFFTGLESGVRRPRALGEPPPALPALLRPFFHEGRALGIGARLAVVRSGLARFEERAVAGLEDPFLFLKYVGLGFWLGFRHPRRAERVEAAARRFGKHGDLVLDGYGFKTGFFGGRPRGLSRAGWAPFLNGLGRSLWFFHMDRPEAAFAAARSLGPGAPEILGGIGLAAAYTFPDDLGRAYRAAGRLDPAERRHFEKGIRIALYVRGVNDAPLLAGWIEGLPAELRARARADLDRARAVGARTRSRPDFIAAFHRGCLEGA